MPKKKEKKKNQKIKKDFVHKKKLICFDLCP